MDFIEKYPEFKKIVPQSYCSDCNGLTICNEQIKLILDQYFIRKNKVIDAITELKLALSCINDFKQKHNWKLLGFEIPIYNAIKLLSDKKS
jgi:hypothetical protein